MKKLVQLNLTKEEAVFLLNAAAAAILTARIQPVMIANPHETGPLLTSWTLFMDIQERLPVEERNALVDRVNASMKAAFGDELFAIDPL